MMGVTGPPFPRVPPADPAVVDAPRYPTFLLCLVAMVLGFSVLVQCASGAVIGLVITPTEIGVAARFVLAGLVLPGAALGSWWLGAQLPQRSVRIHRTAAVTLVAEVLLVIWLGAHGLSWHALALW